MPQPLAELKAQATEKREFLKLAPILKRVAIYCRVSTKGQKEEGTSLEKQLRGCLKKASSDYGLEQLSEKVIQSYIKRLESGGTICENGIYMEDYSGAELTLRPMLSRLRADLKRGLYDVVICFEVDRLSRKMSHRYILKEEFTENNVELVYVKQAFENNAQGEFMEAAHSFVAEVEREKIRDRSIDGKIARLKSGKIHRWGDELFGYKRDFEKCVRVPDPEQVRTLEYIYRLCADEKLGCWAIARRLNNEGIPTPQSHKRPGALWQGRTIHAILRRRDYIGYSEMWKTEVSWEYREGRKIEKRRRREEHERIQLDSNITPPIIDRELWERAQRQLDSNDGRNFRNGNRPCLLRGLIFCAACNKPMYVGGGGKEKNGSIKPSRYRCNKNASAPESERCTGRTCIQDRTDEFIWSLIFDKMNRTNIITEAVAKELARNCGPELEADLALVEKNIAKLKAGVRSLVDKLATCDSQTVSDLISQRISENEKQIIQFEGDAKEIRLRIQAQEIKVNALKFLNRYCERVSRNMERMLDLNERRTLLQALGVKVYADNYQFRITWRFDPSRGAMVEDNEVECVMFEPVEAPDMDRRRKASNPNSATVDPPCSAESPAR